MKGKAMAKLAITRISFSIGNLFDHFLLKVFSFYTILKVNQMPKFQLTEPKLDSDNFINLPNTQIAFF